MGKLIHMFPKSRLTLHHKTMTASSDRNSGRSISHDELLELFNKYFGGKRENAVERSNKRSSRSSNDNE